MAALGPWIGEQKMKGRNGIWRKQVLDRVGNFESCDPRVRQTFPLDSSTGATPASNQAFDAKEICGGVFGGYCCEKRTIAAAEIDFDGCVATKDRPEIESLEAIRGDEFDLTCYCWGRIGGHFR
jgi:hypothetical protein